MPTYTRKVFLVMLLCWPPISNRVLALSKSSGNDLFSFLINEFIKIVHTRRTKKCTYVDDVIRTCQFHDRATVRCIFKIFFMGIVDLKYILSLYDKPVET